MFRPVLGAGLTALIALQASCADLVEPAGAQSAELQNIEALLQQVLERLDTLEAREARRSEEVLASLDTVVVVAQQPGEVGTIGAQLEATICFERSRKLTGGGETRIKLDGRGMGNVGVDAYGNGAQAFVLGMAGQVIEAKPAAEWDFKGTICAKGYGDRDLGSLRSILSGIHQSVSATQLASVATALDLSGTRMSSSLDVVPSLSWSQFGFGQGTASNLVSSLPLPADLAGLLSNPSGILDRAADAAQYAIDRLCSQTLFTGDFAQRAQDACALRDRLGVTQVVNTVEALDGLPSTLSAMDLDLASVCSRVNSMRVQDLTIPGVVVNFPLGIGSVTTFPRFTASLFPGVGAAC
jgi:hypothetical protein